MSYLVTVAKERNFCQFDKRNAKKTVAWPLPLCISMSLALNPTVFGWFNERRLPLVILGKNIYLCADLMSVGQRVLLAMMESIY